MISSPTEPQALRNFEPRIRCVPLYKKISQNGCGLAIWFLSESGEELNHLSHPLNDTPPVAGEERTRQWLACRIALRTLIDDNDAELYKDDLGKPHVTGSQHVSLSHTQQFAVAIAGHNPVGIDIEEITPRITRIAPRFMNSSELEMANGTDNLTILYLVWCAKEALYKLYGKKAVDFARDMNVLPFELLEAGTLSIELTKETAMRYTAHYRIFQNHAMVWISS